MPANAGQYLRFLGLAMEMFGLASVALGERDGARYWPGMTSDQVWSIVIVGFGFWAVGTFMNLGQAARRREAGDDE